MKNNINRQDNATDWFAARMILKKSGEQLNVAKELDRFRNRQHRQLHFHRRFWLWGMAAVAACLAVFLYLGREAEKKESIALAKATVVQADSVVFMTDRCQTISVLATADREFIITPKTHEEAEQLVVTIPQGEYYTIVLPDKSKVFLHAGSKIYFPTEFKRERREVELLYGEAYFQVTHDEHRPFVVKTATMQTTVLGTEFNVVARGDANDNVTLITGLVAVSHNQYQQYIKPGQQASVAQDGTIATQTVDTEKYVAWRDGFLYFDNMTLHDIMTEIGQNYNCTVDFADKAVAQRKFHFVAERSLSVDSVLSSINKIKDVKVMRHGQTIYVK